MAFLFVPLLALTWMLGLILVMLAAHYFLVVIDSSAAGSEKVVWPDEPMTDWLWKGVFFAWLGGAWMAPLVIIGMLSSNEPWLRFVFTAVGFWLLFPIGMLSSLCSASPWVPFFPGLFGRMNQRVETVVQFYLLSIPISLVCVGSLHVIAMNTEVSIVWTVLLAPVAVAGFLVYARALGRLGLVLTFTKGGENEKSTRKRKKKDRKSKLGIHEEQPISNKQPSELPPIQTPYEGAMTGYDVDFEGEAPAPEAAVTPSRHPDDDDDGKPIGVEPAHPETLPTRRPALPPPPAFELALWDYLDRVKEPKKPFDLSLLTFLGEPRTSGAWLILTAGLALFGVMLQLLRELKPT